MSGFVGLTSLRSSLFHFEFLVFVNEAEKNGIDRSYQDYYSGILPMMNSVGR